MKSYGMYSCFTWLFFFFFTQHNYFEIHPTTLLILLLDSIAEIQHSISPVDGHRGYFQFGVIANKAAVTFSTSLFRCAWAPLPVGKMPRSAVFGSYD